MKNEYDAEFENMSNVSNGSLRWISLLVMAMVVFGFFWLMLYAYDNDAKTGNSEMISSISPENESYKIKPDEAGGMAIENKDIEAYQLMRNAPNVANEVEQVEKLLPLAERPIIRNIPANETAILGDVIAKNNVAGSIPQAVVTNNIVNDNLNGDNVDSVINEVISKQAGQIQAPSAVAQMNGAVAQMNGGVAQMNSSSLPNNGLQTNAPIQQNQITNDMTETPATAQSQTISAPVEKIVTAPTPKVIKVAPPKITTPKIVEKIIAPTILPAKVISTVTTPKIASIATTPSAPIIASPVYSPTASNAITSSPVIASPIASNAAIPSNGGSSYIQFAALRTAADAPRVWGELKAKHPELGAYSYYTETVTTANGGTLHRLRAKGFANRNQALTICSAVKNRGQDCLVSAN